MVTVGLTGGIASGKSTVSMEFKKLGAVIIDADKIARALIQPHSSLWKKVIEYFGGEIQKEDLSIDRLKLGQEVFADEAKRQALNRMTHPEIKREIDRRRSEIRKERPEAVVLIDAALLIETGTFREMDKIIVVAASKRSQVRRLVDRGGLNIEEARRRIKVQMPLREKLRYADYVINTDESLVEMRGQVRKIYWELKAIGAAEGTVSMCSHASARNGEREG
jgi:dephospho-CoA kinase